MLLRTSQNEDEKMYPACVGIKQGSVMHRSLFYLLNVFDMAKITVILALCCIVVTALAAVPPPQHPPPGRCLSVVWGPACAPYRPCKRGYSCINRRCCRNPVIGPPGGKCPSRPMLMPPRDGVNICHVWKPPKPMCYSDKECPRGSKCCPQMCGWKSCVKVFPFGGPIGK